MVALAALFFIVGMFLPTSYSVTRSIVVNSPDSVVYNHVANFNNFMKWNPWYKMEPTAKVEISGPVAQPDHLYTWNGEKTVRDK